ACDVVKVLDFGLVKTRVPLLRDKVLANAIVGTPHFMSPEAIQDPAKVDARTDLYSVGAVAFWLLTGTTLFDNSDIKTLLERKPGLVLSLRDQPKLLSLRIMGKSASDRMKNAPDAIWDSLVAKHKALGAAPFVPPLTPVLKAYHGNFQKYVDLLAEKAKLKA